MAAKNLTKLSVTISMIVGAMCVALPMRTFANEEVLLQNNLPEILLWATVGASGIGAIFLGISSIIYAIRVNVFQHDAHSVGSAPYKLNVWSNIFFSMSLIVAGSIVVVMTMSKIPKNYVSREIKSSQVLSRDVGSSNSSGRDLGPTISETLGRSRENRTSSRPDPPKEPAGPKKPPPEHLNK